MTDLQRADLEAGKRIKKFNDDNSVELATITDDSMGPVIVGVSDQVAAVELAESKQQADGGDVSGAKELAKKAMGKVIYKYAVRGQVKAEMIGNLLLASSLDHPLTYITEVDDVLSVTRAKELKQIMDTNKGPAGVLTNIVAADVTIMTNIIKGFTDLETLPTDVIKEKKSEGTDKIQPAIDLLNAFVAREGKLLHSYWSGGANDALVDEFDLKSHAVVLGKRHNIVEVTMVREEDGGPVIRGTFTCLKNNKVSDGGGTNVYKIEGIPQGVQPFKAEAPGRKTESLDVIVKKGTTVEVIVKMRLA